MSNVTELHADAGCPIADDILALARRLISAGAVSLLVVYETADSERPGYETIPDLPSVLRGMIELAHEDIVPRREP